METYAKTHAFYLGPAKSMAGELLPSFDSAIRRFDEHLQLTDLGRIALALALYKREKGSFPESLEALAPGILPAVPVDLFGQKPLHYERTSDGVLLYSIGANLADDHGQGRGPKMGSNDDLAIRMPSGAPTTRQP